MRKAAVALLLAGHLAFSVGPALVTIRNDFASYYVPARLVWEGRAADRLYERGWFQQQTYRAGIDRLASFVPHPPPNALLLLPFAALPAPAAKVLWTLVLVASLTASYFALRGVIGLPPGLLALVFLLPTSSLANALAYGQPYPLLLLLSCLSLRAALRGRELAAGLLLAPVLVLKLYGLAFLLRFAWAGRWRAVAGIVVGGSAVAVISLVVLGPAVHAVYLREVLPATLAGEVQDPFSPTWGSVSSLAHRLFQAEPDLNPEPATDRPALARALARGLPVALVLLAVLAVRRSLDPRREWALLILGSVAASPLTSSYHFLLLILPVAVLVAESAGARRVLVLALFAFVTSPLPHYFAFLAHGWGNLLAYPRLYAVLALLSLALRPRLDARAAMGAIAAGTVAGLAAVPRPAPEPWARVREARGYLQAQPVACEGGLAWVTIAGERMVVKGPDGSILPGSADTLDPGCVEGRLVLGAGADERAGDPSARHARLSPDGQWLVYQSWEEGSWDLRLLHRASGRTGRLTRDPSHEVEPDWMPDGREVVFASDRGRGLGSTALYRVPVP